MGDRQHRNLWERVWKDKEWFGEGALGHPRNRTELEVGTRFARPPGDKDRDSAQVTLRLGRATAVADLPCCGEQKPPVADEQEQEQDGIAAMVLKVAGAAAAGITTVGFITAIGAALFWIRFDQAGLPATQAVGLLSKNELLVQGAQVIAVFVAIALAVVLLLYFADPEGGIAHITLLLLVALTVVAILYLTSTDLPPGIGLGLSLFAVFLLCGCVLVGLRTGERFWPLALAVFVATLAYSAAVGLLVVKEQKYVQAAAVLRGEGDAGVTGVYVAASDDRIYLGRLKGVSTESGASAKGTLFEIPREGATFAVGPLESEDDAEARGPALLSQLIEDRERAPQSLEAQPPADEDGKTESKEKAPTADVFDQRLEGVARAFGPNVRVRTVVRRPWTCLVRYASAESRLTGHWWTSCAGNKMLKGMEMLEIRDRLALPGRFQKAYDMRVRGHLQPGARLLYLEGKIAPQCEHDAPVDCGHRYPGGGVQIYLPDPKKVERLRADCSTKPQDEAPAWKTCVSPAG